LLHGLTANAFCFQAFADDLADRYRLIAYDLRGRGDSDKPATGYSVPIHTTDLAHLIETLGIEHPVVIGHSLGALIALYFAAHYQDKLSKLVLLDAGAALPWNTPAEQPVWLTASINRLGQSVPSYEEYVARLQQAPFFGPYWNSYIDTYIDHDVQRHPDGTVSAKAYREAIIEDGLNFSQAEPEQQWSHVQVPTLLLRAGQGLFFDNDQLLPEEGAHALHHSIADCRYRNFPALNHYTLIFGTEQGPIQEIREFLAAK
jgi:pimeloyl-ACP methyl ester carboxylesterase